LGISNISGFTCGDIGERTSYDEPVKNQCFMDDFLMNSVDESGFITNAK
jgi:hypothetical protein